jgi:hypothetical protein
VGSRDSFSDVTVRCLQETGYRTAFSYYGGVNAALENDRPLRRQSSLGGRLDRLALPHEDGRRGRARRAILW